MRASLRRIGRDVRGHRYIDVYAAALASIVLAVLSLVTDIVPDNVRWAVLLAGVSILVLRVTIPPTSYSMEALLGDRFAFDLNPIADRLRRATEVWIFAPSAVNILSVQNCELLRIGPLSRSDGAVRIVVLNPTVRVGVELATRQLDHSLDYPTQDFAASLEASLRLLASMSSWQTAGSFEYRAIDYNPGFSLVALDPGRRDGAVIVELHGFHNESTSSRMHLEIERKESGRWFDYWTGQFRYIWESGILLDR